VLGVLIAVSMAVPPIVGFFSQFFFKNATDKSAGNAAIFEENSSLSPLGGENADAVASFAMELNTCWCLPNCLIEFVMQRANDCGTWLGNKNRWLFGQDPRDYRKIEFTKRKDSAKAHVHGAGAPSKLAGLTGAQARINVEV